MTIRNSQENQNPLLKSLWPSVFSSEESNRWSTPKSAFLSTLIAERVVNSVSEQFWIAEIIEHVGECGGFYIGIQWKAVFSGVHDIEVVQF